MKNSLIAFKVIHTRIKPKKYKFTHNYFWFKIDLDDTANCPSRFISFNRLGLYSFYDKDHLKLGEKNARANYIKFAQNSGLNTKIKNVTIFTQLRFAGYVFNPVSFILLKDIENKEHAIIEIGNTFNELKPYFVSNKHFNEKGFVYKTKKLFYISPFIEHDTDMEFRMVRSKDNLSITVDDLNGNDIILHVDFMGKEEPITTKRLLNFTVRSPFVSLQFIFFIHLHAFFLWMKGLKYLKKDEHTEKQKGAHVWKT